MEAWGDYQYELEVKRKEEYRAKYGERDDNAEEQLKELRNMHAGSFTVSDLMFIMQPWCNWTQEACDRVNRIYTEAILKRVSLKGSQL